MKRTLSYMFLLLALAGCTQDHKTVYDPEMQMLFHPVMHVPTKTDASNDYPENQPFAINAWELDRTLQWNTDSQTADVYMAEALARKSDAEYWALLDDALWPSRDKRLTVIAYSPAADFEGCTSSDGVSCTYDMKENQADLLYTDPQSDLDKVECGGVVVLPFKHALSQVKFHVKNRVNKSEEIIIKSITVDNVISSGKFNSLPEPTWVLTEETMELPFFEGEQMTGSVPYPIGRTWNVIPQLLNTVVTVEYEYRTASDTGFTQTLKTCEMCTDLEQGRQYNYTLSVGIDEVQFLLEIIEERFK